MLAEFNLFRVLSLVCRIIGADTFFYLRPKDILKEVNMICAKFFQKNKSSGRYAARISWSAICAPKSEGGLGLKDLLAWNQACILRNLWCLFTKAGSLWVAWVNTYVLKGGSCLQVDVSPNWSWSCRRIFKLRILFYQFLELRNGVPVWTLQGGKFKMAKVYDMLRPHQQSFSEQKLLGLLLSFQSMLLQHGCQCWEDYQLLID